MLMCHCAVVSDATIRREVQAGADSLATVGEACGAGTFCGGCVPAIERLLCSREDQSTAIALPAAAPEPRRHLVDA